MIRIGNKRGIDDPLGPLPVKTVKMFLDLGLTNAEIARYFGIEQRRIRQLLGAGKTSPLCRLVQLLRDRFSNGAPRS